MLEPAWLRYVNEGAAWKVYAWDVNRNEHALTTKNKTSSATSGNVARKQRMDHPFVANVARMPIAHTTLTRQTTKDGMKTC